MEDYRKESTQRKSEHLRVCLEEDVRSMVSNGLERYRLIHCALPEIDLAEVETKTRFLGRPLRAPLLISAMTGGTELAREVNRRLAVAAQELGLAMSLGSQRTALEDPSLMVTYQVRSWAPDVLLFANLGAVQLNYGFGLAECRRAVESIGADALVLHLNPLQEALQPEGNTNFAGLVAKIAQLCAELPYPVIVKEVGWGLSARVAQALCRAGVAALDVAGAGGTSWSRVEGYRNPAVAELAHPFANWGIPTAEALVAVRQACPKLPLIASGGISNGVEVAISLALGADLVGIARPLLRPALESDKVLIAHLKTIIQQLRIAMFCSGAKTLHQLDRTRLAMREIECEHY